MIRVLLTDDQPLVRHGLRVLIAAPGAGGGGRGGERRGSGAARGPAGAGCGGEGHPDARHERHRSPRRITADPGTPPKVLILTTFDEDEDEDEYVYGALRAGASGFLVKDMDIDQILAAIEVVAEGDALIAPSVTRRPIAEFLARPDATPSPPRPVEGITVREREVLILVGRGLSNAEIATQLHISIATARVSRLLTRLYQWRVNSQRCLPSAPPGSSTTFLPSTVIEQGAAAN